MPLGSLQSISFPNQGHVACDHVQSGFEYLHNLSGHPVATLDHPGTEYFLVLCFSNLFCVSVVPTFSSPVTEPH